MEVDEIEKIIASGRKQFMVKVYGGKHERVGANHVPAVCYGISNGQALIKPKGHSRAEEVPVEKVKYWKSGNHNDHGDRVYKNQMNKGPDPYLVLLQGKRLFWASEQRGGWVKDVSKAMLYETQGGADIAAGRLLHVDKHRIIIGDDTVTVLKRSEVPAWIAPKPVPTPPVVEAPTAADPQSETILHGANHSRTEHPAPNLQQIPVEQVASMVGSLFDKWCAAKRDVAQAESLRYDTLARLAIAECELEIETATKQRGPNASSNR